MTKEVLKYLLSAVPPHKNFMFQPIDHGDYISLRIFLDNLAEFPVSQQEDLCVWLVHLAQTIFTKFGVPVSFEGDEAYENFKPEYNISRRLNNG